MGEQKRIPGSVMNRVDHIQKLNMGDQDGGTDA